jgi:hypothetical protein
MTEVAEAARRVVLDHLLALSVWAPGADGLVLRGSMPMAGWYLGRARPPGDLDWLVVGGAVDARWTWSLPLYGSLDDLTRDLPEDQLEPPSDVTSFGALQTGREHLRPAGFRAEHRRHWEHATCCGPPSSKTTRTSGRSTPSTWSAPGRSDRSWAPSSPTTGRWGAPRRGADCLWCSRSRALSRRWWPGRARRSR